MSWRGALQYLTGSHPRLQYHEKPTFHFHDPLLIQSLDDINLQIFLEHAEAQTAVATEEMRKRVLAEMARRDRA